jgi:hypothetical protein
VRDCSLIPSHYGLNVLAERVYAPDPAFVTPAHLFIDRIDFVPTNKHVVGPLETHGRTGSHLLLRTARNGG